MKQVTRTILLLAGFFFILVQLQAQDKLAAAVAKLDKAGTARELQSLAQEFALLGASTPDNWLPYYYAALCNAKIGFLFEADGDKVEPFANEGEHYVKQAQALLKANGDNKSKAELYTVISMVYRTKVFINPMTYGRQYGTKSQQYLDEARKLDPDNPRAIYLDAWVKYYAPKMWGGDKDKAKMLLEEALAKLSKQPAAGVQPHWGKTDCEALLAKYK